MPKPKNILASRFRSGSADDEDMLGGDSGDIRYAHHEMPSLDVLYYGIWVLCLTSLVSNEFIVWAVYGDCFS